MHSLQRHQSSNECKEQFMLASMVVQNLSCNPSGTARAALHGAALL